MTWTTTLGRAALAAVLAGCDADAQGIDDDSPDAAASGEDERPTAWVEVASARFTSDGASETLTIPDQGSADAVALRVTSDPGVCFQLSALADGDGRSVVDGRSPGVDCRGCALRTSMAAAAGAFVLLSEAGRFEPETGLALRLARLDCETLTPLRSPEDRPSLRVEVQAIAAAPAEAALDLRFLVADSSILRGDEARQAALIAALRDELATAGIVPRLVDVVDLDVLAAELSFHAGDPSELAMALADAPPKAETTVDVVFGGCLRYDDPIFGPPRPVNGFTPRIPGGAGPADAVFMPGLDCLTPSAGPVDAALAPQARVLAHELGHYLGLFHAVEEDGQTDPLDDTGADNIMHYNPERAASVGFSPTQGRIMRAHPAVQSP